MSTTPNMQLVVPEVLVTTGPQYATQINTALDLVDAHDHSPGKGVRITPSGLNINTDLPFNNSNATSLKAVVFQSQASVLTNQALYSKSGNLCFRDSSGNEVQLTSSGQINVSSVGAITGLTNPAVAAFVSLTDSFVFQSNASTYAKLEIGDVLVYSRSSPIGTAQAVTLVADATTSAYSLRLPIAAPTDNQIMRMKAASASQFVSLNGTTNQVIVTHNTSDITLSFPASINTATITATTQFIGPGTVPVGTIVAIGDAGAWALPASGAIKDGWALCNGQSKPLGSAAGLAATLPDLTDDRFLNGSTAAGGVGGATLKTTTGIAATFNKNLFNSDQIAHTHDMTHKHQWGFCTGTSYVQLQSFNANGSLFTFLTRSNNQAAAGSSTTQDVLAGGPPDYSLYTAGSLSPSVGSTSARNDTGATTASWNSAIVTTTVTQGTISDIRPKYFNVVYVMRVA